MTVSSLFVLEESVRTDLDALQPHEVERIERKIEDIRTACVLGSRDPRLHHDYTKLQASFDRYSFYRKWVGNDEFRLVFEISGERMVLVAVFEKDDQTYSVSEYATRMDRWSRS